MIYLLIGFLSLFASITLLCFIYSGLLSHRHYFCITMCSSRVSNMYSGKIIIITQQQQQHYTVGNIYLFIAHLYTFLDTYYCFVLFMLHFFRCRYYCITTFSSCVLIEVYTTSQHIISNNSIRYVKYISIVQFKLCSTFVIVFTLLSDNISYHCFCI